MSRAAAFTASLELRHERRQPIIARLPIVQEARLSGWQERVDTQTDPQVMLEHVARYRFAAPAVSGAHAWVDLGCGNGLAAEGALAGIRPASLLLVDRDADALAAAVQRFDGGGTESATADLELESDIDGLEARVRALFEGDGGCITCFEVIEHLADFGPLVGMLVRLAEEAAATVVLSVPNDAFWSLHNPYHHTIWGDGAFEEFRGLLPKDALVAHQLELRGSVVQPREASEHAHDVTVAVQPDAVPTHYLVAFGGASPALKPIADVVQHDLGERRAWERQRDADLAWLRQRERDLEYLLGHAGAELDALRADAGDGRGRADADAGQEPS
jgi:SAM-dependent methyltransferase